ncbi:MAG: recombinase family protein [Candidatus Moranbacteria bacterium]|nr:recombinase family protein [Candidatus Moranbacteria bacterium]
MEQKFFLYARKSTDVEDKQVRSIEDQITELRAFAKLEKLEIIEELIEKQSAKIPGRPIFNTMIARIEQGEANGILSWNPDRLARNSVDGGKIIYLVDCGHLSFLKFPTFWFENTSQGKFMLNIAFGQSKYYIDSLSENTKRGLRQKVRRGEYPSLAPIGYINDSRTKTVVIDRKKSKIIKSAFELYAQNNSRLEDIANFLAQHSIVSRNGKYLTRDRISFILSNPFYVGFFKYAGEIHEGKHQPVVSKKIFDQVQEVLKQRSRPQDRKNSLPKAFGGLLRCSCGMGITAEIQKGHTYYRCSRKSKTINCTEPYIRQEKLDKQISKLLQKFSLKKDWAEKLLEMLKKDKSETAQSFTAFVQETNDRISTIKTKLQRLLDGYLEQDIERETYRNEKAKLMSEKKTLEEKTMNLEQKRTGWVEPMENWIKEAANLPQIARESNLFAKKVAAKEIFGSNLILSAREARATPQKQWRFLQIAEQKTATISESLILVGGEGFEPP